MGLDVMARETTGEWIARGFQLRVPRANPYRDDNEEVVDSETLVARRVRRQIAQNRLCLLHLLIASLASAATVTGKVEIIGTKGRPDYSNAVISLEPLDRAPDALPMAAKSMAHQNKTFLPHILPVMVGSKVSFPNRDPFFHNAFSNYDGQIFDVGMHSPGSTTNVTFRRAGVARVFCNIHPTMSAVILVLPTPHFAVTDPTGNYRIAGVPPGQYRLRVFHERGQPEALEALERSVTIVEEAMVLPPMSISTAGYLPSQHKNKYGKEYPRVVKDVYPGQAQ